MPRHVLRFTLVTGAIVAAACVEYAPISPTANTASMQTAGSPTLQLVAPPANAKSYVINFTGTQLPPDLNAQVAAAGGALTTSITQIGVAVASSSDPGFAARAGKIKGVATVDEDIDVQWVQPDRVMEAGEVSQEVSVTPDATFGNAETFRRIQWAPDAVHAPDAWDAGARGAGARVAVLDGGIRSTHIDIAPRLDVAHSVSFVPNQPFNFDQARDAQGVCNQNDTFWHATHVAGIIAAPAANNTPFPNLGTVGIAPDATIIGVKVLHCGSGSFAAVIAGIVYAATPISEGGGGADVINMSLGAEFPRQGVGAAHLAVALGKATTYAFQRGTTVVAAIGNNATDLDHTANIVFLPAMSPHVIAVSATAPLGFAFGATNFDRPASYTNFGQSAVTFAGPGGDFALPGNDICTYQRNPSGSSLQFCWVLDMVIAPCRGAGASISSYCWAAGTSMATPAVSGVAAPIIGRFGRVGPAEVERRLRQSADDLGKPGNDDFYGGGRVNALRAIQ
jgi:lantibiotic leader peptide-processing serine protease